MTRDAVEILHRRYSWLRKGHEYDDLSDPRNWNSHNGFKFVFRFPWPWRAWAFFTRSEYTAYTAFGGTGGRTSTQWYIKRVEPMVPHSGSGQWVENVYVRVPNAGERVPACVARSDYQPPKEGK